MKSFVSLCMDLCARPGRHCGGRTADGLQPNCTISSLLGARADSRNLGVKICGAFLLWAATVVLLPAQTFTTLHNFDGSDGYDAVGAPIQGLDGNFYGTTVWQTERAGSVYKMTPSGTLTTIYSFSGPDGFLINGPLLLAPDGNFYDTSVAGGANSSQGTVFKMTPGGTLTAIYDFCPFFVQPCPNGFNPTAGLSLGADGNFYGETEEFAYSGDCGSLFKITPSGTLTTLHAFAFSDGCDPGIAPVQAPNGYFFGTTEGGGIDYGTIYKMAPNTTLTSLYSFDGITGGGPTQLTLASNGDFYGIAGYTNSDYGGPGEIYRMTPAGGFTTISDFCTLTGCPSNPSSVLVQALDGNFYGATSAGGDYGDGTIFKMTPTGAITVLHSFDGTDGKSPSGFSQATSGIFIGVTSAGGANGDGTIFSLDAGLGPFVQAVPTTGRAGLNVRILGTDLTGASGVTFNGTPATFTVVSASLIRATVPAGATTGSIQVTTPGGVLTSNVVFRVRP
jgi:uncharacterized repeat protein (TIGR03803 family)